jgi:SPX domain protein involved in polyphosphate accumulation
MTEMIDVFERREDKYTLTPEQVEEVSRRIAPYVKPDIYFKYTVHSIYCDSPDSELVINGLQKSKYRIKLRLRAYQDPDGTEPVFLETKKKYGEIVYKKRLQMEEKEAMDFLNGITDMHRTGNTASEIAYLRDFYRLSPKVLILYERTCYAALDEADVRVTFDRNIRYRIHDVNLQEKGDERPLQAGKIVMEVKAMHRYPIWLTRILSDMQLYQCAFSKYGTIYRENAAVMNPPVKQNRQTEDEAYIKEATTCSIQY